MNRLKLVFSLVVMGILCLAGCDTGGGDNGGLTVSGTVTISPATSSGAETLLIAMDTSNADFLAAYTGGDFSSLDYIISVSVPNGSTSVTYEITGVEEDTYLLGGAIDVDGNSAFGDSGDYEGTYLDIHFDTDPPNAVVQEGSTTFNFTVEEVVPD